MEEEEEDIQEKAFTSGGGGGWKQAGLISRWRGSLIGAELRERADSRG